MRKAIARMVAINFLPRYRFKAAEVLDAPINQFFFFIAQRVLGFHREGNRIHHGEYSPVLAGRLRGGAERIYNALLHFDPEMGIRFLVRRGYYSEHDLRPRQFESEFRAVDPAIPLPLPRTEPQASQIPVEYPFELTPLPGKRHLELTRQQGANGDDEVKAEKDFQDIKGGSSHVN